MFGPDDDDFDDRDDDGFVPTFDPEAPRDYPRPAEDY
jgi:hypothetical protein